MLFWRQRAIAESSYSHLAERIRRELVQNFERKGVRITQVNVNIDSKVDNINVKVCMEQL